MAGARYAKAPGPAIDRFWYTGKKADIMEVYYGNDYCRTCAGGDCRAGSTQYGQG